MMYSPENFQNDFSATENNFISGDGILIDFPTVNETKNAMPVEVRKVIQECVNNATWQPFKVVDQKFRPKFYNYYSHGLALFVSAFLIATILYGFNLLGINWSNPEKIDLIKVALIFMGSMITAIFIEDKIFHRINRVYNFEYWTNLVKDHSITAVEDVDLSLLLENGSLNDRKKVQSLLKDYFNICHSLDTVNFEDKDKEKLELHAQSILSELRKMANSVNLKDRDSVVKSDPLLSKILTAGTDDFGNDLKVQELVDDKSQWLQPDFENRV